MNVTIELSATGALLRSPETPHDPMRLHWSDYPEACAMFMNFLNGRIQLERLRLVAEDAGNLK
jgi:hypothetical protein